MDNKPIIKPEWIPAAYGNIDDVAKVKPAGSSGGVPFYKELKKKNKEVQKRSK